MGGCGDINSLYFVFSDLFNSLFSSYKCKLYKLIGCCVFYLNFLTHLYFILFVNYENTYNYCATSYEHHSNIGMNTIDMNMTVQHLV